MNYDVLANAERVAAEAERLQRFEDRGYAHLFIRAKITPAATTTTIPVIWYRVYSDEVTPSPKVLIWWRRLAIRLLGGQP